MSHQNRGTQPCRSEPPHSQLPPSRRLQSARRLRPQATPLRSAPGAGADDLVRTIEMMGAAMPFARTARSTAKASRPTMSICW